MNELEKQALASFEALGKLEAAVKTGLFLNRIAIVALILVEWGAPWGLGFLVVGSLIGNLAASRGGAAARESFLS